MTKKKTFRDSLSFPQRKIRFGTEERATGQCYIVFLEFAPDMVVT